MERIFDPLPIIKSDIKTYGIIGTGSFNKDNVYNKLKEVTPIKVFVNGEDNTLNKIVEEYCTEMKIPFEKISYNFKKDKRNYIKNNMARFLKECNNVIIINEKGKTHELFNQIVNSGKNLSMFTV